MTAIDQGTIVARVRSGEHCPIRWARVPWGRVVLHVAEDALQLDGVRVCVTATTAQRLADLLGCTLPTPAIVDAIHAAAVVRCLPRLQSPGPEMMSVAAMNRHSREVDAQIAGRAGLASSVGKEWVLSESLTVARAANYGWHDVRAPHRSESGQRMWQPLGHKHNAQHTDYSQVYRPVARACLLDGAPADLREVLRSEGRRVLRQPGVDELAAVEVAPGPPVHDTMPAPPPRPFVQARNHKPANGRAIRLVVIHSMESAEKPDTAEAVARWFAGASAPMASAHYCVDSDSIVQCVREEDVAYAAPGANHDGIHVELAGRAGQTAADWADTYSSAMISRAGALVGEICRRHGLPIEVLTDADVVAGRSGITTHAAISRAYKRSSHWDPGPGFPFAALVDAAIASGR